MVNSEKMKDFGDSPIWQYMKARFLEWKESLVQELLSESDINEIIRIQGRLQVIDSVLKAPEVFADDLAETQIKEE